MVLMGCANDKTIADEPMTSKAPTVEVVQPDLLEEQQEDEELDVLPQGDSLDNVVVVLDAGHGGGYVGASYGGKNEKDLTLTVASYTKEYLEMHYDGIEVMMTRENDSALSGDVAKDLEMRAEIAKEANADVLVSFHFNASENHTQQGAMVLVSQQPKVSQVCEELGSSILEELSSLGIVNNGTKTRESNDMYDENGKPLDYYAINRHCANREIPGIIVEHCFMDESSDQQFIKDDAALQALAKADAVGIADYFGLAPK